MARHPRLNESYDWVVIGDSPAALLSAALVARMGLSVLVVGDGSEKKWRRSASGQVIDPEPAFLSGVGHPYHRLGLAGQCLKSLRFTESDWSSMLVEGPLFQALTPAVRAGFHSELQETRRSISREAGRLGGAVAGLVDACAAGLDPVLRYWQGLPQRLTLPMEPLAPPLSQQRSKRKGRAASPTAAVPTEKQVHRELTREISRDSASERWGDVQSELRALGATESEREWIDSWLVGALGAEVPDSLSPFDVLQALVLAGDGVRLRGGLSAFRAQLHRLAVRLGAFVLEPPAGVNRLFVEEDRVLGVHISGVESARNLTRARGVLSSVHPERVMSWVSSKQDSAGVKSGTDLLRITLAVTIPLEGIPVGLARRSVWKEAGAPALEIERAAPEEYGFSSDEGEFLFIRSCLPLAAASWPVERWKTVCERMFRQAGEIIPFLEERAEKVFPDFRSPEFADQWNEFYGGGRLASRDVFRVPVARPPRSALSRIEGLFHAHRSLNPALGAMGEWSSAIEATAWIAHRSGLAGPLG